MNNEQIETSASVANQAQTGTVENINEGIDQPEANVVHVETIATEAPASLKTLYRHPVDKMIGGVCGGLADYFGWEPTIVRLGWIVITLATGGGGFLAYLALWLLMPVGTVATGQTQASAISLNERNLGRAAYGLIALGVVWLLATTGILGGLFGVVWSLFRLIFWPMLLIGAGYMLLRGSRRNWRGEMDDMRLRMRSKVDGRMPNRESVGQNVRGLRDRLPLRRSRSDRMAMGVCGGIGKRLGIDTNLVRLIVAAFSIGSIGFGVLAYVVVGLILPEETDSDVVAVNREAQTVDVVDGSVSSVV